MPVIKSFGYSIQTGKTVFKGLNAFLRPSSIFVICDENTRRLCLPILFSFSKKLTKAHIIQIKSGEKSKSLGCASQIWQELIAHKADKNSLIINLGGGVISDLGGFCASLYKRGIPCINIPTTLLAMADASVGGKTAIDFNGMKNVVGNFNQPKAVFIYPPFLNTLPQRHYQNGMAEIYKMALIADKKLWNDLKNSSAKVPEKIITQSIHLKNKIVLKDPYDAGQRKALNFGHTIGHAIESLFLATHNELLHGEAIVIGMMVESHLAYQAQLLNKKDLLEIQHTLQNKFKPTVKLQLHWKWIQAQLLNDKKSENGKLLFSLINGIGSCKVNVIISQKQILKAMAFYNSLLS